MYVYYHWHYNKFNFNTDYTDYTLAVHITLLTILIIAVNIDIFSNDIIVDLFKHPVVIYFIISIINVCFAVNYQMNSVRVRN